MNDFSTLFSYFEKTNKRILSLREKEEISAEFKKEIFKKKQLVFNSGEENTRHYYIEKGLLRLYIIDQNGKEFNILFARERQWIGDLGTPAATPFYLDAVENSVAFSIEEHQFNKITRHYMDLVKNIRRSYVFLQQRFDFLSVTWGDSWCSLCEEGSTKASASWIRADRLPTPLVISLRRLIRLSFGHCRLEPASVSAPLSRTHAPYSPRLDQPQRVSVGRNSLRCGRPLRMRHHIDDNKFLIMRSDLPA